MPVPTNFVEPTYTYRTTPAGQRMVAGVVEIGMEIRSSYDTGGLVIAVRGPFPYESSEGQRYEHYTVVYVHAEHWTAKRREQHACWINELVAVDGRLLKLFEANDDEVFIVNADARPVENRTGQLCFF